jgi:hypothetical protein
MRKPSYRRVTWVITVLVALGCALPAQSGKNKKKTPKPKPDLYAVVQVDGSMRIVREAALKNLKLEIDQKYKADLADYKAALKEARKKKQKLEQQKPKKAKVKILKRKCKDKATAEAFVAKLHEKERKKQEAKRKAEEKRRKSKSGKGNKE